MIRPGVPAPALYGRLGREVRRERQGVRYHALETRSLLNRCTSPRVPFEWTVNPYRGCTMGCRYCYAPYTHSTRGTGLGPVLNIHKIIIRGKRKKKKGEGRK